MNQGPFDSAIPDPRQAVDSMHPSSLEAATVLASRWRLILGTSVLSGGIALATAFVISPIYTGTTVFMPPQQQGSGLAGMALASLGPLAGLAGGAAGLRSPGEQYVALLMSFNVVDRIVDQFKLMEVYDVKFKSEARIELYDRVKISLGKKDGLITVAVEDESAQRAADIANAFVAELQRLTGNLAITEAQQRRSFFQHQQQQVRHQLDKAQRELEASSVNQGAVNAEPRAAAEAYAKLKAEHTAAVIRLNGLRAYLSDQALEVKQALASISALQSKLNEFGSSRSSGSGQDDSYVTKYREFKYQEALYETLSKNLELARVDEAREGAVIQVIDKAQVPDKRTRPKRTRLALIWAALGAAMGMAYVLLSASWQRQQQDPANAHRWKAFKVAFKSRR